MRKWSLGLVGILLVIGIVTFFVGQTDQITPKKVDMRSVKDGAGRMIEIPQHPKRAVIISTSGLEMFIAAGGEEILAGYAESSSTTKELLARLSGVPSVGRSNTVSLEKIISLKPDLVIGSEAPFHEQLMEPLKQARVPLLLLRSQRYQDNVEELQLFGELTERTDLTEKMIEKMEGELKEESERRDGRAAPKVLLIFGTSESFLMVLPTSLAGDFLRLAGGKNVADEAAIQKIPGIKGTSFVPFSLEFAHQTDPDHVFFIIHGQKEKVEAHLQKALDNNDAWLAIPAIREGRFTVLPQPLFGINPGIRSPEAIKFIGQLLYPE